MLIDTTRRSLLAAFAALPVMAVPALALTDAQAEGLVEQMTAEIVQTINSGKSEASMYREFERLMERYADMNVIARSSLGPAARSVSSGELRAYTAAYKGYVSRKYGKRFREFIGGRIEVTPGRRLWAKKFRCRRGPSSRGNPRFRWISGVRIAPVRRRSSMW